MERFQRLREKYWRRISVTVIVVCWTVFIVGSQVSQVSKAFVTSGAVQLIILTLLLDMSIMATRENPGGVTRISGKESDINSSIVNEVRERRILNADLLEFSGVTVEELIRVLATRGCKIRLLVKHPDTVGPFQKRRIIANLEALFGRDYVNMVEARCYRYPASLRGRRLGNELINLGWYTPLLENGTLSRYEVMGHDNALVTAPIDTPEGRNLERMFQGVFDSLWTANDTEDGRAVVNRYSEIEQFPTNPPKGTS
jgi:hypothetical protein